jgi:hypothetical protein
MNETRSLKKGRSVHGVERAGFLRRQPGHLGGDHLQAIRLEAGVDLADHVFGNRVGLDDGKGAFDGHELFSKGR